MKIIAAALSLETKISSHRNLRDHPVLGWMGIIATLVLAGCQTGEAPPQIQPGRVVGIDKTQGLILGTSVEGREIRCRVFGDGPQVILVLAAIHGTEAAGTPLVERLAEYLLQNPELLSGKRVLLIPVANPDGLALGTRGNARGVDLNRNFEAGNRENSPRYGMVGLSEPESRALHGLILTSKPDRIVTIHQPLNCLDYDGPAGELARAMGAQCDLPVQTLGARPGSLGSYAGVTLGIPIVTMELPRQASTWSSDTLWKRYGKALLTAVTFDRGE
jgi:murein peptide amidase A